MIKTEIKPKYPSQTNNHHERDEMEIETLHANDSVLTTNIPQTNIFVVTDSLQTISSCKKNILTVRQLLRSDTKDTTSQVYAMHQLAKEFNANIHFIHQRGHTISNNDDERANPLIKLQDICDKYAKIAVQKGRNEEPFFFSPLRNLTGLQAMGCTLWHQSRRC